MPKATAQRNMIRKTFLREDIWNQLGFAIKIIFLIASTDDCLNDEIKKFDDILLLDFEESHYYLPAKEQGCKSSRRPEPVYLKLWAGTARPDLSSLRLTTLLKSIIS